MSKITFHLHKLEKTLVFQVVHIDDSLINKAYFDTENCIVIGYMNSWCEGIGKYPSGYGRSDKFTLLINCRYLLKTSIIDFESNTIRDNWYNKIIETIGNSVKNNLWY